MSQGRLPLEIRREKYICNIEVAWEPFVSGIRAGMSEWCVQSTKSLRDKEAFVALRVRTEIAISPHLRDLCGQRIEKERYK